MFPIQVGHEVLPFLHSHHLVVTVVLLAVDAMEGEGGAVGTHFSPLRIHQIIFWQIQELTSIGNTPYESHLTSGGHLDQEVLLLMLFEEYTVWVPLIKRGILDSLVFRTVSDSQSMPRNLLVCPTRIWF